MFVFFDKLFLLIIDNIYISCAMREKKRICNYEKISISVINNDSIYMYSKNLLINLDK